MKNDFSRKPISLTNSVKIIGRWWLCGNRRGHADRPKEASCGPAVDFDRIIVEVAHEKVPRACGLVLMDHCRRADRSLHLMMSGSRSRYFASLTRQALRFFQPILLGRC